MTARNEFTDGQRARPATSDNDGVVTRSEEELWIATHRRETQRARLTRYFESETVTKTVEVRHEQVRVEYEPIPRADEVDRLGTGSAAGGDGWMVLYDEEVVVTTRRVPRERVRMRTHTITEDREITETLLKEQIEVSEAARPRSSS
jgi:stress response protein YsnF